MSNYIHILKENPVFELVAKSAADLGFDTYVIGGFVRDMLLKRSQKSKDIDFVCVGSGVKLAEQVAKNSNKNLKVTTFQRFGTAMLKIDDWELEFVGARKESYRQESRKPTVENGTLEDDQNRRDFTINALALSLNKDSYGKLLDPFNTAS